MDFKKESVHSMVEKIVTDAQTAYGMVPNKYVKTSENFGRVDKGACLGLIAFVRWVAATPLWNGASQYGYNLRRVFENEYAYDIILRLARELLTRGAKVHIIIRDKKDGIRDGHILSNSKRETCMGDPIPLNQVERLKQRCKWVDTVSYTHLTLPTT